MEKIRGKITKLQKISDKQFEFIANFVKNNSSNNKLNEKFFKALSEYIEAEIELEKYDGE